MAGTTKRPRRGGDKPRKPGMQIDWKGRRYVIREDDLTPRDIAAIRKETGFPGWAGLATAGFDLDVLAALLWLARRLNGEHVQYDSVLDEVSYDDEVTIGVEGKDAPVETVDSPEA